MFFADRLAQRVAQEMVSQGARLASQAIHEGFQTATESAKAQAALVKERERNAAIYREDLLLAKLAVCFYIANADGEMSDNERNAIGRLVNQILRGEVPPTERVRTEVLNINKQRDGNFVVCEKYLQPIKSGDLAAYLQVAEELANADEGLSEAENNALNTLREYVSDRSGKDFTSADLDDQDLICQSCGGHMELSEGGAMLVCPFCGTTRVVSERKLYAELKEYNFAGVSVGDDFFDVIEARLARGQKIEAIRYAVDKLKIPLKDAKDYIETYENDMDRTKYDCQFRGQGRKV